MSRIEKTLEINAPIEKCYKILLHFEQYPDFIPNIQSIQSKGQSNVWHWHINCPNEAEMEWDVEIHGAKHQHYSISWHTVREADVAHSGAITLQPIDEKRTRLHLVIDYKLYAIVSPTPESAEQCLERCLQSLKAHIEQSALSQLSLSDSHSAEK